MSPHAAPLSAVLRARTAAAHDVAETSPYLRALGAGRVTAGGLAALLSRLAPVYEALESAAPRWAGHARVGRFVRPELDRAVRLRADLVHLTGSASGALTPASRAYAARIEQAAGAGAAAFVAHHYTRYLGDLAGGQVIRSAVEGSLGLVDGGGASFFAFPGVAAGGFLRQYRGWLDATPFDRTEREELVEETLLAYRLNVALAAELDAELIRWTSA